MAHTVKRIARGSSTKVNNYAGPAGELIMDTTTNDLVLETGVQGGVRMAKASTVIAASNGVEISAGGSLATGATVSGIDATTSAKGVVQLSSLTSGASETLAATEKAVGDALQAAKDYTDATVKTYTGAAPIGVSASNEISISPATTTAAGSMSAADKTKLDGITEMTGATALADGATGLVPQPDAGEEAKYLRGDGTWATPDGEVYTAAAPINIDANNKISISAATTTAAGSMSAADKTKLDGIVAMTGATASEDGTAGLVPAPSAGDQTKYFRGDGTWQVIADKPWTGYEADSSDIVPANYQDNAIIETDEPVGGSSLAVLAEVEQSVSGQAAMVPSSAAVKAALAMKADVLAELYVSPTGSDDNDGLTAATALATPQEAMNRVNSSCASGSVYSAEYPSLRGRVSVHIAAGTYTGDMMTVQSGIRIVLGGNVTISGVLFSNVGSLIAVVPEDGVTATLTCAGVTAQLMAILVTTDVNVTTGYVSSGWGSYISLEGSASTLSITTTGNKSALSSTNHSSLRLRIGTIAIDATAMNSTSEYVINARYNSDIYYNPTTVTISFTKAAGAFRAGFNSIIALGSSSSTTITGTVNTGTAVSTGSSSFVRISGTSTMSGTVTGRRYFVDVHSCIRPSASTNTSFFPGSTDGKADTETYGIYK